MKPQHFKGHTFHKRLGDIKNQFQFGVDYILIDPAKIDTPPRLFSHNKANLVSFHTSDNGGQRGLGTGLSWVQQKLRAHGLQEITNMRILLLTQPRVFGHVFNPVSFWLVVDSDNQLRAAIAEVNNTFAERHAYLCHHPDLRPIKPADTISAQKIFYVSPFQPIDGAYNFRFSYSAKAIGVRIDLRHSKGGIVATLTGSLQPLTSPGILKALVTRPFGSLRVLALIFYQALKLRLKGAQYRPHIKSINDEAPR